MRWFALVSIFGRRSPGQKWGQATLLCGTLSELVAITDGLAAEAVVMKGIELGLKALGTSPRRPLKVGEGEIELPLTFGGVTFRPGEWRYADADADGVVLSPCELSLPETSQARRPT